MNKELKTLSPSKCQKIQTRLLEWFDTKKRDLPWRQTKDPYKIWVSEVMLQQTQVKTVIPYYRKFIKSFPTVKALGKADLNDVLKQWEGLGYYSRARYLHQAAVYLHQYQQDRIPTDSREFLHLPGIGKYTAGAICSIAYNEQVPVLDGNVIRVLTRILGIPEDPKKTVTNNLLWKIARQLVQTSRPGDFNQSMMELGALLCFPTNPFCTECPLQSLCVAYKNDLTDTIPYRRPKRALPHKIISAGVVTHRGKILISQRPLKGMLGGLWEFPGGKLEKNETLEECLIRELKEELDITVAVGDYITAVEHAYSHFSVTLHFYYCTLIQGKPKKLQCHDFKWVKPDELKNFAFPGADQPVLRYLVKVHKKGT